MPRLPPLWREFPRYGRIKGDGQRTGQGNRVEVAENVLERSDVRSTPTGEARSKFDSITLGGTPCAMVVTASVRTAGSE